MAGAGAEPPTFRSEVQHTNHYTTAPPRRLAVSLLQSKRRDQQLKAIPS